MICNVVVEGRTDKLLVQRLLDPDAPPDDPHVRIIETGGWSLADSTARSILAVRQEPVALVVDADATSPELVEEQRRFLEDSLRMVASSSKLFRVFLFIPEMEVILFEKGVFEQLKPHFRRPLSKPLLAEVKLEGKYAPKRALQKAGIEPAKLVKLLETMDLAAAKEYEVARELRKFVLGIVGSRAPQKRRVHR